MRVLLGFLQIVRACFKGSAKIFDSIYEYAILFSDPEIFCQGNPGMLCVLIRDAIPGREERMLWRRKLEKTRKRKQLRIAKLAVAVVMSWILADVIAIWSTLAGV